MSLASASMSRREIKGLPGLRIQSEIVTKPSEIPDGALSTPHGDDNQVDAAEIEKAYATAEAQRLQGAQQRSLIHDVFNISNVMADGAAALVDDSFLRCFASQQSDPWNWNIYLFPAWLLGVVFRYCILFPLRFLVLIMCMGICFILFFTVQACMKESPRKQRYERVLVQFLAFSFVISWTGVIRYHGPKPTPAPHRIWVANHTSMIDYGILCSYTPFAVIMQLHQGWVRFIQTRVLRSLGCLWFNRTDIKDRHVVAERMKAHIKNPDTVPLLVFPEGTCVNNEYTVLFKRGAFDMEGVTVCPVAIKYNKIFVDAFWNSKKQSFAQHLLRIMTSWALVCDVWFLEPQVRQPNETPEQFASRVQHMIASVANLRVVPWDGYLKYYNLGEKNPGLIESRRKVLADMLRQYLPQAKK